LKGFEVKRSEDLEQAVQDFLSHPGPALLDVHTNRYELVMPPTVSAENVIGMATYSAKALLSGRISDVKDLMKNALHDLKR
jgi:pyruvate dehydrogenase (quinone)